MSTTHATQQFASRARTKIVATLGPASREPQQLHELMLAGVDVFRLNMAHGTPEQQQPVVEAIRSLSHELNHPVGILADLAGPKIRLGELAGGELELRAGEEVWFVRGEKSEDPRRLVTTYAPLVDELAAGDRIMLADGTVSLTVEEKAKDSVRSRVRQGGVLLNRQGVNLPGVKLSAPALGEVDRANAVWAAQAEIDFVGLSFVRQAQEVRQLKDLLKSHRSQARVVAKIEKQEALDGLDEIVDAADGLMVARGDLGVEIDVARTPLEQKRIIAACQRRHKPVIVATQMLDSMRRSLQPTRAEVTDVANAILDGADACMLSGETAIGDHPAACVEMMNRIALATEPLMRFRQAQPLAERPLEDLHRVTEAVVGAVGLIAEQLRAKLIVVATHSGATALAISKQRGPVPIIAVSDVEGIVRQMCLYWGVTPLRGVPARDSAHLLEHAEQWGRSHGLLDRGDYVVLVSAIGLIASGHNMLIVHEVR
jgi:pyruvate kinase